MTVHGCTGSSPLTGCQVTSRPCDRFSRYWKWTDNFRQPTNIHTYTYIHTYIHACMHTYIYTYIHTYKQNKRTSISQTISISTRISLYIAPCFDSHWIIIRRSYKTFKSRKTFKLFALKFCKIALILFMKILERWRYSVAHVNFPPPLLFFFKFSSNCCS